MSLCKCIKCKKTVAHYGHIKNKDSYICNNCHYPKPDWASKQIIRGSGLVEDICKKHGVGHPNAEWMKENDPDGEKGFGVHGCCGCCHSDEEQIKSIKDKLDETERELAAEEAKVLMEKFVKCSTDKRRKEGQSGSRKTLGAPAIRTNPKFSSQELVGKKVISKRQTDLGSGVPAKSSSLPHKKSAPEFSDDSIIFFKCPHCDKPMHIQSAKIDKRIAELQAELARYQRITKSKGNRFQTLSHIDCSRRRKAREKVSKC